MADSIWQDISYLNLLWLLLPLAALFLFAFKRRQRKLRLFAASCHGAQLTRFANTPARLIRAILLALALALMVIALARPAWNKTKQPVKAKGRDVVFILDISRSMLAQHRNTTRLEEAKFAIQECLNTVHGDRVALVIFAGNPKIVCPLTHDYAFFLAKLEDVDYRSVAFGGTMLGDAVRLVCDGIFKSKASLYRDVIVITDGEDMQSNPIQAAERLAELNARLIAVGMGDETPQPLVINTPDGKTEQLSDNGKPVMTRLDADTLKKMSTATQGGVFIPVHADTTLNLSQIYDQLISRQLKQDFEEQAIVTYEEKFQIFLLLVLLLLALARMLPERRTIATALLTMALLPNAANAQNSQKSPDQLVQQAYDCMQNEKPDQKEAETMLKQALEQNPEHLLANFNQGILNYQKKNYQQAMQDFQRTISLANAKLAQEKEDPQIQAIRNNAQLAVANAAYKLSQKTEAKQPQTTPSEQLDEQIQHAKLAVDGFQQALNYNPKDTTAAQSLKAAKVNHKKLLYTKKQLQKQQQDKQNQDKQNQDKQNQDKQNQDKQNQDKQDQDKQDQDKQNQDKQNQDKQNQDKQNQDKQNQDKNKQQKDLKDLEQQQRQAAKDMGDQQKSKQDLQQQQQDLNQQARQQADKQEQKKNQDGSPQNKKAEDFLKEAARKQQEAQQNLNQDRKEQAQQAQKEAADLTRMARKALDRQPDQPPESKPREEKKQDQQQPQQPKPQQPKPMDARAMDAINQEQINRKEKKMFYVAPPARMNKDW